MKNSIKYLIVFLILPFMGYAQEGTEEQTEAAEQPKEKLERAAFESSYIIDNQTDVILNKKALEVMFQHRFGLIDDWNDFYGIWGAANIRLGASYGVHERVTLGVGTTKNRRYQDINWKVAILRQTRKVVISYLQEGSSQIQIFQLWEIELGLYEPVVVCSRSNLNWFFEVIFQPAVFVGSVHCVRGAVLL